MSKVTTYKCDRCGKDIPDGREMTSVTVGNSTYDMCDVCYEAIKRYWHKLPCKYCVPEEKRRFPLLDGEYDYAYIDVPAKQLVTVRFEGECGEPISHRVYVNIGHCPMCGRRL